MRRRRGVQRSWQAGGHAGVASWQDLALPPLHITPPPAAARRPRSTAAAPSCPRAPALQPAAACTPPRLAGLPLRTLSCWRRPPWDPGPGARFSRGVRVPSSTAAAAARRVTSAFLAPVHLATPRGAFAAALCPSSGAASLQLSPRAAPRPRRSSSPAPPARHRVYTPRCCRCRPTCQPP